MTCEGALHGLGRRHFGLISMNAIGMITSDFRLVLEWGSRQLLRESGPPRDRQLKLDWLSVLTGARQEVIASSFLSLTAWHRHRHIFGEPRTPYPSRGVAFASLLRFASRMVESMKGYRLFISDKVLYSYNEHPGNEPYGLCQFTVGKKGGKDRNELLWLYGKTRLGLF